MMQRVVQWLGSVKPDKWMHFVAGLLITEVVSGILSRWVPTCALFIGLAASAIAGWLKERWDGRHGGVVSYADFAATLAGGIVGLYVMMIALL